MFTCATPNLAVICDSVSICSRMVKLNIHDSVLFINGVGSLLLLFVVSGVRLRCVYSNVIKSNIFLTVPMSKLMLLTLKLSVYLIVNLIKLIGCMCRISKTGVCNTIPRSDALF